MTSIFLLGSSKKNNYLCSPYAGDIRTLQAVDIPELNCLQDVLVFSTQGDRMFSKSFVLNGKNCFFSFLGPDFHKISGSDLDGDHYFVSILFYFYSVQHLCLLPQAYWGNELQLPQTVEPLEYHAQSGSNRSTCITSSDIINYCLSSLHATSHGEIYNLHAVVVDKNRENHPQRTCQKLAIELATMFAAASKDACFLHDIF